MWAGLVDAYQRDLADFVTTVAADTSRALTSITTGLATYDDVSDSGDSGDYDSDAGHAADTGPRADSGSSHDSGGSGDRDRDSPPVRRGHGSGPRRQSGRKRAFGERAGTSGGFGTMTGGPLGSRRASDDEARTRLQAVARGHNSFREDPTAAGYQAWAASFKVQDAIESIEAILDSAPGVRRGFDELVPEHVSFDLFWKRYLWRAQAALGTSNVGAVVAVLLRASDGDSAAAAGDNGGSGEHQEGADAVARHARKGATAAAASAVGVQPLGRGALGVLADDDDDGGEEFDLSWDLGDEEEEEEAGVAGATHRDSAGAVRGDGVEAVARALLREQEQEAELSDQERRAGMAAAGSGSGSGSASASAPPHHAGVVAALRARIAELEHALETTTTAAARAGVGGGGGSSGPAAPAAAVGSLPLPPLVAVPPLPASGARPGDGGHEPGAELVVWHECAVAMREACLQLRQACEDRDAYIHALLARTAGRPGAAGSGLSLTTADAHTGGSITAPAVGVTGVHSEPRRGPPPPSLNEGASGRAVVPPSVPARPCSASGASGASSSDWDGSSWENVGHAAAVAGGQSAASPPAPPGAGAASPRGTSAAGANGSAHGGAGIKTSHTVTLPPPQQPHQRAGGGDNAADGAVSAAPLAAQAATAAAASVVRNIDGGDEGDDDDIDAEWGDDLDLTSDDWAT